jgi:NADH-quinone oxidoreductase subunit J
MSTSGEILFLLCGVVAVVSAVLTVTLQTPLRAAVALLAHIIALAGLYLTLHAHLLAAIQLLVYAGAIVVLFVFVIMLMGAGAHDSQPAVRGWVTKTFGAGLIVLLTGAIAFVVGETEAPTQDFASCSGECDQFGGVNQLSQAIYRDAAIPFELVSMLLLVAIIAAIAVARGKSAEEKGETDPLDARKHAPRPFPDDPTAPPLNPGVVTTPAAPEGTSGEPSGAE